MIDRPTLVPGAAVWRARARALSFALKRERERRALFRYAKLRD
jgi:hypothetical protein